jgi:hypothetical protein
MVGFGDLLGIDIAPISKKMAVNRKSLTTFLFVEV